MKIANNITELIGATPLVKLNRLVPEDAAEVLVKLESFNPGKSVKDRIALNMIEEAEKEGVLKPGGTIVEPTSGNTGIGLSFVGIAKGYNVILTMPDTMSIERRKLLKAYGAELVLTPGEDGMPGAIDKAKEMVENNEDYFMPQQFNNKANPQVHRETTAQEIIEATDGQLDAFVAGVGTGGTITGTGEVLKQELDQVEVIAIEPTDSAVISGEEPGPHMIQGIGAGFIPEVLEVELLDEVVKIENEEAMKIAQRLAQEEGILVGISSGAAVAAAIKVAKELGPDKRVVTIAPDTGERYLSTPLFKEE
ncbi:cysteine synthase A [Halobacteroides halobius DSM 5150]|uniref:Cysteine synthase n=1 Tax=Halobacteroides halobius (strain ATCC 35273 / DSM 5150 / MD-1) TaxID=748449 RepID=L0KCV3_HALHC|nr:cysteine synthase A [Halobacteroides halobius]AGB42219.1 cysteine synthase A [Halobacteroides halobius DSM 5150]